MRNAIGKQTTIAHRTELTGIGVHSGKPATVVLSPAGPDTGIIFIRTDGVREVEIPARFDHVVATELCTVIGASGATVATIEHLMAAVRAMAVDNLFVEIDGPEMPILDGCSADFVAAIEEAEVVALDARRKAVRVLRPVRVEHGDAVAELLPFDGARYDVTIDFASDLIGRQSYVLDLDTASFRDEIARARTFGFMRDVEKLWKMGFAMGSSLENSVAIADDRVLNPEGLRWVDEFVRHKTLDAVGDLALAGMPFIGHFRSYKGGHRMNWLVLKALFADSANYEIVGEPVRRQHSAGSVGVAMPALAPQKA